MLVGGPSGKHMAHSVQQAGEGFMKVWADVEKPQGIVPHPRAGAVGSG